MKSLRITMQYGQWEDHRIDGENTRVEKVVSQYWENDGGTSNQNCSCTMNLQIMVYSLVSIILMYYSYRLSCHRNYIPQWHTWSSLIPW